MENVNYLHSGLTMQLIQAFFKVYNTLGYGFLEKVYENAYAIELDALELKYQQQKPVSVYYNETKVGFYFCDIIVEEKVILELKSAENLCPQHEAQLINYLRATNIEVGLLLNFGKDPQFKRKVFSNKFKNYRKDNNTDYQS